MSAEQKFFRTGPSMPIASTSEEKAINMKSNYVMQIFAAAILTTSCFCGCGPAVKAVVSLAKFGVKEGVEAGVMAGVKGAVNSVDDLAKARGKAASTATSRNVANTTLQQIARTTVRQSFSTASTTSIHCGVKIQSLLKQDKVLTTVQRVTLRVLLQQWQRNHERLETVGLELNAPSLSDLDAERIASEVDDLERKNAKIDALLQQWG